MLAKYPATETVTFKPVDLQKHQQRINQLTGIATESR